MTHLELENLASDYLEGLLDTVARVEVEAHLKACEPCREVVADVRHAMETCRAAEKMEPAPWVISRILLATVGERKPTLGERISAFLRPQGRMRLAYTVAMALFSFSVIINATGLNLRHLTIEDLNPRTWFYRADSSAHLLMARAEKFYYDLRVVYEIQSRVHQFRQGSGEGNDGNQQGAPKTSPGGAKEHSSPETPVLADMQNLIEAASLAGEDATGVPGDGRSALR